jgi:predicted AlkP superfamily phosphohydrolase/phosphomutase
MRKLLFCALVACSETPAPPAPPAPAKAAGPRLVILGFDGVDPRRVDALVARGELQHLAGLGGRGYRGPLATTNPPQSPTAWSAFATGLGAGRHGVFDFVGRDVRTYFPEIATNRYTHAEVNGGAVTPASAENLRTGDAFWDVIARAGIPVRTFNVPYAYPPPADGARSLSGLGTPDVRGTNSTFTLLTASQAAIDGKPPAGGQIAALRAMGAGAWSASIAGPRVAVDGERRAAEAQVIVRQAGEKLAIEVGSSKQTLGVGETGAYVEIAFVPSPALTVRAATRFTVRRGAPEPEIYAEPLSNTPAAPYFPVSNPPALAEELWKKHGPWKTVGWIDDTSAVGADAMDEKQFVAEAFATMRRSAEITVGALREGTDRLVVSVFTSPDRIGHMLYRHIDPAHPARDAKPNPELARALDDAYLEMDRIVGEVRSALSPEDKLLVMSDHGFGSFRRGFHMNSWLRANGFQVLKPGAKEGREFFQDVDWKKTKAYALGTGSIFLNIAGRERDGSVPPEQARKVAEQIAAKLKGLRDGKTPVVRGVLLGDEAYDGPRRKDAPDVRVALAEGYRASWATSLGSAPAGLFEDNTKKWSGDHASALPEDVPGILVSSAPIASDAPRIEDLAATAFAFFEVPAPAGLVGRNLIEGSTHATR